MLVIENLSKKYKNNADFAVEDLSLVVEEGEIVGFLGPNGAGKSTTLKAIVGIVPFDKGKITICGFETKHQGLVAKQNIGYVSSDDCNAYERFTGRQYLNFISNVYGVDLEIAQERAKIYQKTFNFEQLMDMPISTYSFGYKQIIHLISILIRKPKVWILDEPTIGLAPEMAFEMYRCMKKAKAEKTTIFFSSHHIADLEKICDRVAIIKNGQILEVLNMKKFKKSKKDLEKYYLEKIGVNTRGQ